VYGTRMTSETGLQVRHTDVERYSPAYTPEAVTRILAGVESGLARSRAAALAGVSASTLAAWERAGLEGDTRYTDLADRLAEADVKAENAMLTVIRDAAVQDGDWKAAAWVLERRFPQAWGPPKPVQDDLTKLSDDEIARRLSELEGSK
jgi:hypothetical protein